MKKILYLTMFVFFAFSCNSPFDSTGKSLTVHNYSNEAIYIYYTYYNEIQSTPKMELFVYWPDRAPDEKDLDPYISPEYRVNPHVSSILEGSYSREKWIPFPEKNYVNFFFIKESTMKNYKWEEIVAKQMYVKKIRYTYDELEKMHYKIFYKP